MPRGNESRLSLEDELRISELELQASEAEKYFERLNKGFGDLIEDLDESGNEIEFRERKIREIEQHISSGCLSEEQLRNLQEIKAELVREHDQKQLEHMIGQEVALRRMRGD